MDTILILILAGVVILWLVSANRPGGHGGSDGGGGSCGGCGGGGCGGGG